MTLLAEFEVGCDALPLVTVAQAVPTATIEVRMVPHADGHTPFIVSVTDQSPDAVESAFESAAFVAAYDSLGTDDRAERYKIHPAVGFEEHLGPHVDDLDGLRALATNESTIERIRVTTDGWVYTGWFATRSAFDEFREFWRAEGYPFRLRRLTRDDRYAADGATDDLTQPQRDAIRTAYEMGYFDIPRGTSLEAVAAELDISAASLSERLRRAQSRLVEFHIDATERYDGQTAYKTPNH